jgi:hypothetical protein
MDEICWRALCRNMLLVSKQDHHQWVVGMQALIVSVNVHQNQPIVLYMIRMERPERKEGDGILQSSCTSGLNLFTATQEHQPSSFSGLFTLLFLFLRNASQPLE